MELVKKLASSDSQRKNIWAIGIGFSLGMLTMISVEFILEKIEEKTARCAGVQRDGVDQRVTAGVTDTDARHHLEGLTPFQFRREVVPFAVGGQAVRVTLRVDAPRFFGRVFSMMVPAANAASQAAGMQSTGDGVTIRARAVSTSIVPPAA